MMLQNVFVRIKEGSSKGIECSQKEDGETRKAVMSGEGEPFINFADLSKYAKL